MDKRIVGTNAGKVWCALKEIGEISTHVFTTDYYSIFYR